jgi:hypothetical protein
MNTLGEMFLSSAEVETVEAQVERKVRLSRYIACAALFSGAAMMGAGFGWSLSADLGYTLKASVSTHYFYTTNGNEVISPPDDREAEKLIYGGGAIIFLGSAAYGGVWLERRRIDERLLREKLDAVQPEDIPLPED